MTPSLPPGPRWPAAMQTAAWWSRPLPFFLRGRARFGARWTTRLVGMPPFVVISDPDQIRQALTAPPEVLHPGEGAKILEPVVGPNSVILLDEGAHLEQRRLMLPPFKGQRMAALTGMVEAIVADEVASWPRGERIPLHPRLQRLTLEIILRAVFGLDPGPRMDRLRVLLEQLIALASGPLGMLPPLQRDLGPASPGGRFARISAEIDGLLEDLVAERRAEEERGREDIMTMLLVATHEDGSPMSFAEIRDELVTALVAGHETTASQLAWTFALLARHPEVLGRLTAELDAGDGVYLDAVLHEALRIRPVLLDAEPRLTKEPYELGGWTYPAGVVLDLNALLVHHDPAIYPQPWRFRPERFLERSAGTYTWFPFGGGVRRCLGASFALFEMKQVLAELVGRLELRVLDPSPEPVRRRAITLTPGRGAEVLVRERARAGVAA